MTDRLRCVAVWLTEEEAQYVRTEIEREFGDRDRNGIADGRAVCELLSQRPSFVRAKQEGS